MLGMYETEHNKSKVAMVRDVYEGLLVGEMENLQVDLHSMKM